jgi:hypothetical protein
MTSFAFMGYLLLSGGASPSPGAASGRIAEPPFPHNGTAAAAPSGAAAKAPAVAAATGEAKIKGRVSWITPISITVRNRFRAVTYRRGARPSLAGIRVGTFVEAEGRRVGGVLRLTSIHRED